MQLLTSVHVPRLPLEAVNVIRSSRPAAPAKLAKSTSLLARKAARIAARPKSADHWGAISTLKALSHKEKSD